MLRQRNIGMRRCLGRKLASFVYILSCISLPCAFAAELGPWEDGIGPLRHSSSLRKSWARIHQDDAALLDSLDLDEIIHTHTAASIVEEAQEPLMDLSSQQATRLLTDSRRLELHLTTTENPTEIVPKNAPSTPKLLSTGTTIVGCLVEQGKCVVLGADTRATEDRMVADKSCEKIHCISTNVWCCGAGTSADLDALTRHAQYSMNLQALQESSIGNDVDDETGFKQDGGIVLRPVSVSATCRFLRDALYDARGSLGVNLIVGGYDIDANEGKLTAIHPHGSMDVVPYTALGSGGLAAMSVLESRYRPTLTRKEGIDLVKAAVLAGIENDLGSGSQVDLCVMGPGGSVEYTRAVVPEQALDEHEQEDDAVTESIFNNDKSNGVNGFGNLPYTVNSRRVVASVHDESTRLEQWNALLGLDSSKR